MSAKHVMAMSVGLFLLQGCAASPHVEDWQRERFTEVPDGPLEVAICFDQRDHSKEVVYALAREECGQRISEVENLIQTANARQSINQTQAEGRAFEGSVQRSKRIQAMIASLQLKYLENDKWDCPLLTPNRIKFECVYNQKATDSQIKRQSELQAQPSPDLPPELPDDLKPQ